MGLKMPVLIPREFLQKMRAQAERDYPNETCGILIGPKHKKEGVAEIYPCRNAQDDYHAQDPADFPRTAKTAYFIEPRDLLKIQKEAREKGCEMRVIYHSHVDAGDYFSEEDQRIALLEGEPAYPGVSYGVISVMKGKSAGVSLFAWDSKVRMFIQYSLDPG